MQKKSFLFVVLFFILAIIMFIFYKTYYKLPKSTLPNVKNDSIEQKKPLDGYHILLDAGHGGFDPGSLGGSTGVKESVLNLEIVRFLRLELIERGCKVSLTRAGSGALAQNKREDMLKRQKMIAQNGYDACFSIHLNTFTTSAPKGPMVFYYKGSIKGELLSQSVQNSLNTFLSYGKPRSAKTGDYMVLRAGNNTCVLVECGFLSNPNDELLLQDEKYQRKIAFAIAVGIENYFSNNLR